MYFATKDYETNNKEQKERLFQKVADGKDSWSAYANAFFNIANEIMDRAIDTRPELETERREINMAKNKGDVDLIKWMDGLHKKYLLEHIYPYLDDELIEGICDADLYNPRAAREYGALEATKLFTESLGKDFKEFLLFCRFHYDVPTIDKGTGEHYFLHVLPKTEYGKSLMDEFYPQVIEEAMDEMTNN